MRQDDFGDHGDKFTASVNGVGAVELQKELSNAAPGGRWCRYYIRDVLALLPHLQTRPGRSRLRGRVLRHRLLVRGARQGSAKALRPSTNICGLLDRFIGRGCGRSGLRRPRRRLRRSPTTRCRGGRGGRHCGSRLTPTEPPFLCRSRHRRRRGRGSSGGRLRARNGGLHCGRRRRCGGWGRCGGGSRCGCRDVAGEFH
jgi:hypothetical protein